MTLIKSTFFPSTNYRNSMSLEEGNLWLKMKIISGEPFAIVRYGAVELGAVGVSLWLRKVSNKLPFPEFVTNKISNNAGFFPCENELLHRFSDLYLSESKNVDGVGVFYRRFEEYILDKYCQNPVLFPIRTVEPYYSDQPWSLALKGKTVLVVYPFEDLFHSQYANKNKLYSKEVIPEFELKTVKAVQTSGGAKSDFLNWFDALAFMKKQIAGIDFDIALVGAGAYGMPLVTYIKSIGRQAISMGGATQVLFGIKGKRWDNHETISNLYNDYWVYPPDTSRPLNADKVEGGCYW